MRLLFITICYLLCVGKVYSQQLEIELTGSVDFSNSLVTISEAGLDFPESLEATSEVYISIFDNDDLGKKKNPNNKWTINVNKQDTWSGDMMLEVIRTGSGSKVGNNGQPNIKGGEVFQEITSTGTYFCQGLGEIVDIPLRLRLSGLSVTMGAGDHNSDVIFTIYEGW